MLVSFLEAFMLFVLVRTFIHHGQGVFEFLMYPSFGVLCVIYLLRQEHCLSFLTKSAFAVPIQFYSKYTYILYLTHVILIYMSKQFITSWSKPSIFLFNLVGAVLLAIPLYHIEKNLERQGGAYLRGVFVKKE